jgi:hypothetical protein
MNDELSHFYFCLQRKLLKFHFPLHEVLTLSIFASLSLTQRNSNANLKSRIIIKNFLGEFVMEEGERE